MLIGNFVFMNSFHLLFVSLYTLNSIIVAYKVSWPVYTLESSLCLCVVLVDFFPSFVSPAIARRALLWFNFFAAFLVSDLSRQFAGA